MLKVFLFLLVSMFICAPNICAQTKRSEISDPNAFRKLDIDKPVADCRGPLRTCGEKALVALDLAGFGGPDSIKYTTEIFEFKNGVGIFLFSITGIKDPLIAGERLRLAFIKRGTTHRFVQAGRQYLCVKGGWKTECLPETGENSKTLTKRGDVANADDFRFMSLNGSAVAAATKICRKTLAECGAEKLNFYLPDTEEQNKAGEGETFVFADKRSGRNTGIYLFTMTGFEDDSVSGERYRIEFLRKDNAWELVQGGRQFQCARGASAGTWTNDLCP
ncbi:MAG: hypothetical protein KIS76_08055 [Pyrinomonadaceae bacterium]|nr:hypothetical protein [Pyrinomonadaceae bacterium]